MAPKASKIDDVKRPEKVTPSASGRPLLISNEPTVQTDPMMAPSSDEKKDDSFAMSHTGKEIKPLDSSLVSSDQGEEAGVAVVPDASKESGEPEGVEAEEAEKPQEAPVEAVPKETPAEPAPEKPEASKAGASAPIDSTLPSDNGRDPEAAQTAEAAAKEEAKIKREQELETLIASGKYEVPIDAVKRKRSRKDTILLCILAVVLAVILLDVIADVGIIKVPSSVPHTHYFSK